MHNVWTHGYGCDRAYRWRWTVVLSHRFGRWWR
jgi:hypothetical protein